MDVYGPMNGGEDTEKRDSTDEQTNKGQSPRTEERTVQGNGKREDGLKGQAMETKRAYVTAAGLCVNVASSQEAICRDNDKILTLELRKCSERRTNG